MIKRNFFKLPNRLLSKKELTIKRERLKKAAADWRSRHPETHKWEQFNKTRKKPNKLSFAIWQKLYRIAPKDKIGRRYINKIPKEIYDEIVK